jgi:hypothetical protein
MILFSSPVLGAILFILGIALFIKFFFNLSSAFFKPFFTLLLIFIGLNVIFTDLRFGSTPESNTLIFKTGKLIVHDPNSEYNVMFSSAITDFTTLGVGGGNYLIDSNTVFAKNKLLIKADTPTRILLYPTLGLVKLPNGMRIIPFFKNIYTNKAYNEKAKAVDIKISSVFGVVEIEEK